MDVNSFNYLYNTSRDLKGILTKLQGIRPHFHGLPTISDDAARDFILELNRTITNNLEKWSINNDSKYLKGNEVRSNIMMCYLKRTVEFSRSNYGVEIYDKDNIKKLLNLLLKIYNIQTCFSYPIFFKYTNLDHDSLFPIGISVEIHPEKNVKNAKAVDLSPFDLCIVMILTMFLRVNNEVFRRGPYKTMIKNLSSYPAWKNKSGILKLFAELLQEH